MLNKNNYFLQEAVAKTVVFDPAPLVADYKKALNACALTKFKSEDACFLFFSGFFMNQVQVEDIKVENFIQVYNLLWNDVKFVNNLTLYMGIYKPGVYEGMFKTIMNMVDAELFGMKANRLQYMTNVKAFLDNLIVRFSAIKYSIEAQTSQVDSTKFVMTVLSTLQSYYFYMTTLIKREIQATHNADDIEYIYEVRSLPEDAQSIIDDMIHAEEQINEKAQEYLTESATNADPLDEGIVNKAVEKAKEANYARKKAETWFEQKITKKVNELRNQRRNRKHAEMVGEALRINHELKRLLRSGILYIIPNIGPAAAVITYIVSIIIDRETDKKDRDILVGQLKDELEIIEEKISIAERNGDDKAKIELIRLRQKIQREYRRITKLPYEGSRSQNRLGVE